MNNKQIAQRWFEEIWNQKHPEVIAELLDPSAVGVTEGGVVKGPGEFRTLVFEPLVRAFPDVTVTLDGLLAENDDVVIRWTASASHQGPLMHLEATGKRVKFSGMTWMQFKNGKIMGGWDSYNLHGLFAFLSTGHECASVRRG